MSRHWEGRRRVAPGLGLAQGIFANILVKELIRGSEHPGAHVLHAGVDPHHTAVVLQ